MMWQLIEVNKKVVESTKENADINFYKISRYFISWLSNDLSRDIAPYQIIPWIDLNKHYNST